MDSRNHPIKNLTAKLKKHQAFSSRNFSKIAAFYLKLIIQEPFRFLEEKKFSSNIRKHELNQDPIFIIGHWRSGTSFLQYLLGQDPQFGFMNKFQVIFPDLFLRSESYLKELVNQLPDSISLARDAKKMSVNLDLDSPSEIEIALTTMISPTSLHWGHIFPEDSGYYFDKYLFLDTATESEITKWKKDYSYLIKKVSLKNDGRQLLIKSPGNTSRIKELLKLYPNAKFIFLYRNPYDVFYSSKKLWNTLLDNLSLQEFSERKMENEIIRIYEKLMTAYLKQRSEVPKGQLIEIRFEEFISDPLPELRNIYTTLGINGFKRAKPGIKEFLNKKTEGKSSNYAYENRIIRLLNQKWQFAFEEWNYSMKNRDEPAVKENIAGTVKN